MFANLLAARGLLAREVRRRFAADRSHLRTPDMISSHLCPDGKGSFRRVYRVNGGSAVLASTVRRLASGRRM